MVNYDAKGRFKAGLLCKARDSFSNDLGMVVQKKRDQAGEKNVTVLHFVIAGI